MFFPFVIKNFHFVFCTEFIAFRETFCFCPKCGKRTNVPGEMRVVDPLSGVIYEIPEAMLEKTGTHTWLVKNIPITDYPLLLTFGDFAD